jgi:hypothetical protein
VTFYDPNNYFLQPTQLLIALYFLIVKLFLEISEEVQKSLITPLPAGRQGLNTDYTDKIYTEKPV